MKTPIASPRARTLAAALREARESRGVGLRELSRLLDVPHPLLSYWEKGTRLPTTEDVAHLLGCLQVTGERKDRIIDLARDTRDPNWLAPSLPHLPHSITGMVACEQTAIRITMWTGTLIPGLLQTADYIRAILSSGELSIAEGDRRLADRLQRQEVLRKFDRPDLVAIMAESALKQNVGDPAIMSDQVDHLLEETKRSNISLRLVPAGEEWYPALISAFVVYEFRGQPPIVFLEHYRSGAFLYENDDVQSYQRAAKTILSRALSEEESRQLIARERT